MIPRHLQIALLALLIVVLGLGIYGFYLKHQVEENQARAASHQPIPAPVVGSAAHALLFLADDQAGALVKKDVALKLPTEPNARAREVLRALILQYQDKASHHPLGPGADVTAVFLINGNFAVVNLNAAFVEGHRSGILVEELTLASMAQTLAANLPGITRIKIVVDGKQHETLAGHADTLDPYDVTESAHYLAALP